MTEPLILELQPAAGAGHLDLIPAATADELCMRLFHGGFMVVVNLNAQQARDLAAALVQWAGKEVRDE